MIDYEASAAALIAGGWRPSDIDDIQKEYCLTDDEKQYLLNTMIWILARNWEK